MKIGILTFHRANNNGAFLQCYSLQKEIKRRFPDFNVEIIDYYSGNMKRYYDTNFLNYLFGPRNTLTNNTVKSRLKHMAFRMMSFAKGNSGLKSYYSNKTVEELFSNARALLPVSTDSIVSDDYTESIEFIKKQKYDAIVVGSDAVWNDYQTDIPNVFYLHQSIPCKKYSYAASCYGMDYRKKGRAELERISDCLKDFSYVGVRDTETEEYIRTIDENIITHHNCDPTLFLELDDVPGDIDQLRQRLREQGVDLQKPIIGVMGSSYIGKIAREVCGNDAQLVSLFYENKHCNASLVGISPLQWAKVFGLFVVTFTSFFHGTIFSLKNGTPTITIEQNNKYAKQYTTKTEDLLKRLNLDEYYVREENQNFAHIGSLFNHLISEDQKTRIMKGITGERGYSESFFETLEKDFSGR